MTHAVNFGVGPELSAAFNAPDPSLRALIVQIDVPNEVFVLAGRVERTASAEADFASGVRSSMTEDGALYVLFCSDANEWTLMSYVPDNANAKSKMLYSSAKDALRRALGGAERLPREQHWSSLVTPPRRSNGARQRARAAAPPAGRAHAALARRTRRMRSPSRPR